MAGYRESDDYGSEVTVREAQVNQAAHGRLNEHALQLKDLRQRLERLEKQVMGGTEIGVQHTRTEIDLKMAIEDRDRLRVERWRVLELRDAIEELAELIKAIVE